MERKYYILGGVLVLLLILAGALFFSNGSKPPPPDNTQKEIVWWKVFEDNENVRDLIQEYRNIKPNVKITFVKKDPADYEDEIVRAIASGNPPDIISIHNDWLPEYETYLSSMPDALMNLRTYQSSFVDVAYSDFVKDNKIYGIPLAIDTLALYYNKDILGTAGISLPPSTWPELVSDVQKTTQATRAGVFTQSGIALGTSNNVNRAVDVLALLMLQNGTQFYTDDRNSATFDRSQTVPGSTKSFNPGTTALAFYTQFSSPAKTSYTWNVKSDQSIDAFTQGKLGMMVGYQYMMPVLAARAPNLNWGVAPVPQISTEVSKINFANYWGEAVTKTSKNQQAAWEFLNFISSKDALKKYYEKHKLPSSRKDILAEQVGDVDIGVFAESALTARSVYKKDAAKFEGIFVKMIDDIVLSNVKVDTAIRNAVQQVNLNLRERK